MRRLLGIAIVAALAAGLWAVLPAKGDDKSHYWVQLDNAFGLVEGGDVKVAGVRAGTVTDLKLDRRHMRALIGIEVTRGGFGDLRTDTFCEAKAQSLIGEYFLDCDPGTSPRRLPEGGTVTVGHTGSTVPVDLVTNIYRRPYRERFSIILQELGAGLAARGGDLNETIRRASPALREVDKVLAILRDQRRTIRDLYRDADRVIGRLADNRKDVSRFVLEARDTARTVASRDGDLRRQYQTFPTFLREFRPTIRLLGEAADRQAPALRTLRRTAPLLERFLATLGPFAEVSQPAFRSLAGAARAAPPPPRAARPRIAELRAFAKPLPETATNLAITLEHLDDPKFAIEKDARAGRGPNGGYTGLEALLRYFFAQSQAINLFDANSYFLKVTAFLDRPCANYADETTTKDKALEHCHAWLGPNQPGVTTPDPTKTSTARARHERRRRAAERPRRGERPVAAAAPVAGERRPAPAAAESPAKPSPTAPLALPPAVGDVLDDVLGGGGAGADRVPPPPTDVLDYLLGA